MHFVCRYGVTNVEALMQLNAAAYRKRPKGVVARCATEECGALAWGVPSLPRKAIPDPKLCAPAEAAREL